MMSTAKGMLGRLPVSSPWTWALLLILLTLVYQVRSLHLDDRLYFWIQTSWHETEWQNRSLWLPEYRVRIDVKAVPGVSDNLSGLTYDERRDQLWAVVNNPEELLVLSTDGEVLARFPLSGFSDVEASPTRATTCCCWPRSATRRWWWSRCRSSPAPCFARIIGP